MKKYRLILAFGLGTSFAQAQEVDPRTIGDSLRKPSPFTEAARARTYLIVEQMPEFQDGATTLRKYLSQHIRIPEDVKDGTVQGKVFVAFVIDEQGNVREATVVKGLSQACDEEAVRMISQMPRWKPGRQNGEAVPVKYVLPVIFKRKII